MIKYFEVKNKSSKMLRGIINVKDTNKKSPCFILCHGFTGNKTEYNSLFVRIAESLEQEGFCVFRFDFMGSGESDGTSLDMTLSTEIDDCNDVIDYVKNVDFVDEKNINLLGFSMGGAVSIVSSVQKCDVIKNTVLMSAATNIGSIFISEMNDFKLNTFFDKNYINCGGFLLSKDAVYDAQKYNLFDYAEKMPQKNILLVHGTNDQCVSPISSKILKDIFKDRAELCYVKNADHCYTAPEYEAQLIKAITDFAEKIN